MKNTTANIGSKIKEVRLLRKLTQNELCGTELTRNHLSLIESGKSLPSLKNLCYIADRLEVPIGYFFSSGAGDAEFINYFSYDEIRDAFKGHDFQKCIRLCEAIPDEIRNEEISLIYGKSLFTSALSSADKLNISAATELLAQAEATISKTIHLGRDFEDAIEYYKALFSSITSSDIPSILCDAHFISLYVPAELVMYMKLISGDSMDEEFFTSSRIRLHATAVNLMRSSQPERAFGMLTELSELSSLPYYMKYRVYSDLEKCAEEIGEFKTAYSAAKRKMDLLKL